ncbi:MAG: YncE family protein [Gemmatimonadota bacterium]|nr:YncE family protein [Gemmatimonadota bacterium]MDH3424682.1 YncE family protein [Gemmatimonadota bacterium]
MRNDPSGYGAPGRSPLTAPVASCRETPGRRARSLLLGLVLWISSACAGGPTPPSPVGAQQYLYVASQEDVSVAVIDLATNTLVTTVDLKALGYPATAKAHDTSVDPDGSHWYVSLIAAGKVLKFDRDNRLVSETEFETPGLLVTDPTSDRLYVGRSMAAVNPPQRIGVVERTTMSIEEVDVFFPRPHALAVDALGERFFAASLGQGSLAYAPLGAEEVDLLNLDGMNPMIVQFAVSPDGRWLVGTGQMSGDLMVFDVSGTAPRLVRRTQVGEQPWHPSFTPDGREVWIPNQTGASVTVVETSGWTITDVVRHAALVEPHGSAVAPDGRTVYVSGRNTSGAYRPEDRSDRRPGTVVAIDRASREVVAVIEVGAYAAGMSLAGR